MPERFTGSGYDERADKYLRHLTYRGGRTRATATRARRGQRAARLRARGHRRHGLLGLLPRGLGPHPLRPRAEDPGRPGPGLGGRLLRGLLPAHRRPRPDPLRPALRALPQPGPQADARHRHGLRRALPRRHDPLRRGALRRGPRGADRHLLDHQGPSRGARRGPGARLPLQRRGPDRQGDAAAGHGPGHPAVRPASEKTPGYEDGYEAAAELREMYESDADAQAGHRRGQGPRGPAPPGRHPRRRRRDHQGPADRVPARSSASPSRAAGPRTRPSSPSTRCTASRSSGCSRWTSSACATSR